MASVLAQTYRNLELIVVQNGEDSEGKEVVEEFSRRDGRVRYLYRRQAHPSLARNAGIRAARGAYIAFLDDDDEWLPEKLARQIDVLEQHPDISLVTCRAWVVGRAGEIIGQWPRYRGELTLEALVSQGCLVWSLSSVLVRRSCLDRVGWFNPKHGGADDYGLYLRIAKKHRLFCIPDPFIRYHWHGQNASTNQIKLSAEFRRVLRSIRPSPGAGLTWRAIRESIARTAGKDAHTFYALGVAAFDAKRYGETSRFIRAALACDPLIGTKISWSRFANPAYRFLRPYAMVLYCALASLVSVKERSIHANG
jgi:glycosyltransferase involved in cell wall biosynthesis